MLVGLSARHFNLMVHHYQGNFAMPRIGHISEVVITNSKHISIPENPTARTQYEAITDSIVGLEPLSVILRSYVEYTLARHGGNVTEAAKRLGINRRTISRWREEYERADIRKNAKRRVRPTG